MADTFLYASNPNKPSAGEFILHTRKGAALIRINELTGDNLKQKQSLVICYHPPMMDKPDDPNDILLEFYQLYIEQEFEPIPEDKRYSIVKDAAHWFLRFLAEEDSQSATGTGFILKNFHAEAPGVSIVRFQWNPDINCVYYGGQWKYLKEAQVADFINSICKLSYEIIKEGGHVHLLANIANN